MKPLGLIGALLSLYQIFAQTPALPNAEKSAIEGAVTSALSGAPVANADVIISKKDAQKPVFVRTDTGGHFAVDELDPGHYSLRVERTGYVPQTYGERGRNRQGKDLILEPGRRLQNIDVRLVSTGVIDGRVFGVDDEPRVRANVQALAFRYARGEKRHIVAGQASTNDLGEYRIFGLLPGRYYLVVSEQAWLGTRQQSAGAPTEERYIPTYYPSAKDTSQASVVDLRAGGEARGVVIRALRSQVFHIRGKILGAATARHVRVQLHPMEPAVAAAYRGADIAPDAKSAFDFGGIISGTYIVLSIFSREGRYYSGWRRIEVVNADVDDVSIATNTTIELPGRVRVDGDKDIDLGKLIADLRPANFSPTGPPRAPVKSDGSFIFYIDGPDSYQLSLYGLPEDFYVKAVHFGDQEVVDRRVDLSSGAAPGSLEIVVSSRGGRIDGRVKNEAGDPVSGAVVALVPEPSHRHEWYLFKETTTDQDGHFTLLGIAPGEYKLFAWEDVETEASENPEFLKPYEAKGEIVQVKANGAETTQLRVLPAKAQQ